MAIAVSGLSAESIAAPSMGNSKRNASSCHEMSMSSGSRVRRLGYHGDIVEPKGLSRRLADSDIDLHR